MLCLHYYFEDPNVPTAPKLKSGSSSMKFTPALLRGHLKHKQNYTSSAFHGVTYFLLKRGRMFLCQLLSFFSQFCLVIYVTPVHWKIASIVSTTKNVIARCLLFTVRSTSLGHPQTGEVLYQRSSGTFGALTVVFDPCNLDLSLTLA